MRPATKIIHTGERVDTGETKSLTVPIYETTTGFTGGTPPPGSAS